VFPPPLLLRGDVVVRLSFVSLIHGLAFSDSDLSWFLGFRLFSWMCSKNHPAFKDPTCSLRVSPLFSRRGVLITDSSFLPNVSPKKPLLIDRQVSAPSPPLSELNCDLSEKSSATLLEFLAIQIVRSGMTFVLLGEHQVPG